MAKDAKIYIAWANFFVAGEETNTNLILLPNSPQAALTPLREPLEPSTIFNFLKTTH